MKASVSDQRAILDIARYDIETAKLNHTANTLPEIAELKAKTVAANNARDLRVAAETELADIKPELLRAEADVEQIVSRITRDEARLNSGTGAAKELEQLQHELVSLNARRSELEEAELEIMMRIDSIKDRVTALKAEEEALAAEILEINIRKENALAGIASAQEVVTIDRASAAQGVDSALMAIYEKVRENGGAGAAALTGGACTGCNLAINTIELQRIASLPEDEVVRCDECRCILVRI